MTGPAIPPDLDRQHITVLRLTRTANRIVALLAASGGHAVSLLAAWSADNGLHWALSPALALRAGVSISSSSKKSARSSSNTASQARLPSSAGRAGPGSARDHRRGASSS